MIKKIKMAAESRSANTFKENLRKKRVRCDPLSILIITILSIHRKCLENSPTLQNHN